MKAITVGIDLRSRGIQTHAELVALWDVTSHKVFWTGKSYPTSDQERDLVQVVDLNTHLMEAAGARLLVLGCHDLNMFSPRVWANSNEGSPRRQRCAAMRKLAVRPKPDLVLQHPHSTDTERIWSTAWSGVTSMLPNTRAWASGLARYRYVNGRPAAPRQPDLDRLCAKTRGGPVLDLIVRPRHRRLTDSR